MIDKEELTERERLISHYESLGLSVETGFDQPGTVYDSHGHERTILYTLDGSLVLKREGRSTSRLLPGVQAVVETGQIHSAVVGENGWEYIAASDASEAALFEH